MRIKKFDKSHCERFDGTVKIEQQSFDAASLQTLVSTKEGRDLARALAERMVGAANG